MLRKLVRCYGYRVRQYGDIFRDVRIVYFLRKSTEFHDMETECQIIKPSPSFTVTFSGKSLDIVF